MSLLFLICALLTGASVLVVLRKTRARISQQCLMGLKDITQIRRLIETLPQHRGMANALLQGDESFRSKLTTLQAQINKDIQALQTQLSGNDCWGATDRVRKINKAWSTILENPGNSSASKSFSRHTALIAEVLYLINDVADAAGLLNDTGYSQLVDTAINTLPLVTETLGQARGIGTGAAARGRCSTDVRVKLRYLLTNTRQVSGAVNKAVLSTLSEQNTREVSGFNKPATEALNESRQAIVNFLSLLETGIIHDRSIEITPADFYAAGTSAIQHSFTLLDIILTSLRQRLTADARNNQQQLRLAFAMSLVLLTPAVYFLQILLEPLKTG